MDRIFVNEISELILIEKRFDIYRIHLDNFSYDEWVFCKKCASSVVRWMPKDLLIDRRCDKLFPSTVFPVIYVLKSDRVQIYVKPLSLNVFKRRLT